MRTVVSYENVDFLAARTFTYDGEVYKLGQDVKAHEWPSLETLIRTRHLVPVVDDGEELPRQGGVRNRSVAYQKMGIQPPKRSTRKAK